VIGAHDHPIEDPTDHFIPILVREFSQSATRPFDDANKPDVTPVIGQVVPPARQG
jgi:hypothetical protein